MSRPEPMVKMLVYIPKGLRDELERIKVQDGVTISQQVRYSLGLWVRRVNRDPHGAWGPIGNAVQDWKTGRSGIAGRAQEGPGSHAQALQAAIEVQTHPELDPEPNPSVDPVGWSSWAARQGNAAVKTLAAGYFGHPDPKGTADE